MRHFHLIISLIIVFPASLWYGIYPDTSLPWFIDLRPETTDLKSILRALMGMYLGFSIFWLMGILKPGLWRTATLLCMLFMGGLGLGRGVSWLIDGAPSPIFIAGTFGELILAFFAFYQLKTYKADN